MFRRGAERRKEKMKQVKGKGGAKASRQWTDENRIAEKNLKESINAAVTRGELDENKIVPSAPMKEDKFNERVFFQPEKPDFAEVKMQLTKGFFFDLENRLRTVKWDPPFDEITAQLLQKEPVSADEFARRAIYVVLAGGFRQKTAKAFHTEIMNYLTGQTAKSGEQMFADLIIIFGHENKINAIIKIWQNRQKYRNGYYSITSLSKKLQYLQSLPHIGPITRNHLARNLGEDVPKYDIWVQRLGVAFKEQTTPGKGQILKDKINNAKLHPDVKQACDEMFVYLVKETGLHICYIDLILWKACESGVIGWDELRR
jgi:hypothetical protein